MAQLFEAAAAADSAQATLDDLLVPDPRSWLAFDDATRTWTRYRNTGIDIAKVGVPLPETALGFALAMASGDGHRRAEALRHSSVAAYPQLYPLVLVRAVDHVEPIRKIALGLLARLISAHDHEIFGAVLTVSYRLRERRHAEPMLDLVLDKLGSASDEELLAALAAADGRSARWTAKTLIERDRLAVPLLAAIALGRFDDRLQELCADALAARALTRDRPDLLQPLAKAPSGRVRTAALTGLVRLAQFHGLEEFLTDRSAPVRATAQWGLRRAGRDPASYYRALLQRPMPAPRTAIQGLGDCGQAADADLVEPFLVDPRPKTRAAAVEALRSLGTDRDLSRLLDDSAPVVTRAVAHYLSDRRMLPPVAVLRELIQGPHPPHVRRSAVALLRAHGVWHRIWVGLVLYRDADQWMSIEGLTSLDYLCRYQLASVSAPLDDELRNELRALVRARSNELYLDTRQTLQWLLDTSRTGSGPGEKR
ncbi:HEAT repeat domain-containing protein [Glycomyces sp. YM15]|uniref:HEAT repeat domain-containing protein n=1 Tax=Glycomyces sp. YM15 TaxID=2800446 RepID=UPI0019641B2F|nr:HEAT repeat domain-containing protein [Glycomyces sp. YM15]